MANDPTDDQARQEPPAREIAYSLTGTSRKNLDVTIHGLSSGQVYDLFNAILKITRARRMHANGMYLVHTDPTEVKRRDVAGDPDFIRLTVAAYRALEEQYDRPTDHDIAEALHISRATFRRALADHGKVMGDIRRLARDDDAQ